MQRSYLYTNLGTNTNSENYRPVSLLPQFSKVVEKLFNNRLDKLIDKHILISESQYGFKINRSTSLALIDSIEEIPNSLDQKKYTVGILIDLTKAFDTINHYILFKGEVRFF